MDFVKRMTRKEFIRLPCYNKEKLEIGKTYKLFGKGFNQKASIGYIKIILSIESEKIKSKIHEVQITD